MRALLLAICLWSRVALAGAPPLGPAEVVELDGQGQVQARGPQGPRAVHAGDQVADGATVQTGEASRLELRFPDGGLLRLGPDAAVRIAARAREVEVLRGRVLVRSDLMVGGVTALAQGVRCETLGTTYLVESDPALWQVRVLVLVGIVRVSLASPLSGEVAEALVLPAEVLVAERPVGGPPGALRLGAAREVPLEQVVSDRLLRGWAQELPDRRWLLEHLDEQRRGVLTGRNRRLRREVKWKRPLRKPIVLPELFQPR